MVTNPRLSRHAYIVEAWMGLLGVLAGAAIAIVGQRLSYRSESRDRLQTLVLERASQLVALSEDFRNRVWEERHGVSAETVVAWDLAAFRLAEATLRLLCPSPAMTSALRELRQAGQDLGKEWRLNRSSGPQLDLAWERHRKAIEDFLSTSSDALGLGARLRG